MIPREYFGFPVLFKHLDSWVGPKAAICGWKFGGVQSDLGLQRMYAKELVQLQPDVILAHGTTPTGALQRETSTIPIVFAAVSDPVGEGFVESLPRPGGNITGF